MRRTRHQIKQWIQREFEIWRIGALPGLAIIALIGVARLVGTLQYIELAGLDYLLRFRPTEATDERVLIVGIDEADIRKAGTYPIPDASLAALIQKLQTYQPAAIGLDVFRDLPVEPGYSELVETFEQSPNLIGTEIVLPDVSGLTVAPPPALPASQVGFVDTLLDFDGYIRRSLLGTPTEAGYKFSLTFRLAETYLFDRGVVPKNGIFDPEAIRFNQTELTRVRSNSGSYTDADANGNQILINFRSGTQPFNVVSMTAIMNGAVPENQIRDRVVLIGITSLSAKDVVNSRALIGRNPNLIYGVEIQAHAVSQILSAVLDGRPLLKTWPEIWEYIWIGLWGLLGISLGRIIRSPFKVLLGLGIATVALVGVCCGLLILGWWVPVAPALLVLVLNGAGLTASLFYRHEQNLKARIEDRQMIIDQAFTAIHNGPLQILSSLLRDIQSREMTDDPIYGNLQHLNQSLRSVYETVRQEALSQDNRLYIDEALELDLDCPLHESLYAVYSNTLARDFPCFKTIQLKLTDFRELDDRRLTIDQRKALCRFLEEALCNVGKYASGITQLKVECQQIDTENIICITDNGNKDKAILQPINSAPQMGGQGTRQAEALARQLRGKFQRSANQPQGTICKLTWPVVKPGFWRF